MKIYTLENLEVFSTYSEQSAVEISAREFPDTCIQEGKRNITLTSLAGSMRRRGMESEEIEAALIVVNHNRCIPVLPDIEIRNIVRSICRYPPALNADPNNKDHGRSHQDNMSSTNLNELPEIVLFRDGTGVSINDTACSLGEIYTSKEKLFRRISGESQSEQIQILDKNRNLKIVTPELACSEFETVAKIVVQKSEKRSHAILNESHAKRILPCSAFIDQLPPLRIVTRCPVIIELTDGELKIISNYDRSQGIYAMGDRPLDVCLDEAIEIILESIGEFYFNSPSDKSRAIASILTPALVIGGIGNIRSPIELCEADESQAGKGFKAKISAAIYNEIPFAINQQHGGVGSLEESMNQALIEGRIFINFDNLTPVKKGVFNSEKLCSFMTEDVYYARMLRKGMFIDPRSHIIQMTTNGCTLSKDLMNRSNPVAIKKRYGFNYKKYPEGSILDHIRHNQSKFLGAVFTVIKEWCKRGKPKTSTTAHESSFTPWAQSLDWIVQNIMRQPPLLDGYEDVRDRITKPYLQKIREIALTVLKSPRREDELSASDIMEIVGPEGVELPGGNPGYNFENLAEDAKDIIKKQIGVSFGRAFEYHGRDEILFVDGIKIVRREKPKTYDYGATKLIKVYQFSYV